MKIKFFIIFLLVSSLGFEGVSFAEDTTSMSTEIDTPNNKLDQTAPTSEVRTEVKSSNPSYATSKSSDFCSPESKVECEPCKECEICPSCKPEPCCRERVGIGEPCNCAYNAPARIDPICGWDVWVCGSFLYWQAQEDGLELGVHFKQLQSSPPYNPTYSMIKLDFDYHPGFKVGLGCSFERDDWSLYLEYTRYSATEHKTKSLGRNFTYKIATKNYNYIMTNWGSMIATYNPYSRLKGEWELNFNLLDLYLERPYYLGKKLIFNPHCGLKSGWIDQKYDLMADYMFAGDNDMIFIKQSQDSWLMGPEAGVQTKWLIGCNFRIFANFDGALFYQKFKNQIKEFVLKSFINSDGSTNGKLRDNIWKIIPNVDISIGLGYGTYFWENKSHIDITLGYDLNYFWNQNRIQKLSSWTINHAPFAEADISLGSASYGSLMLHGLNLTARIDF